MFDRSGLDLQITKEINIFELISGSTMTVKDILGAEIELTIPKRTKPGSRFKIPKHGLSNSGRIGDLYVLISPVIPDIISDELLKLIELEVKPKS